MAHPFRHNAGFGKRMKYWIIGRMLKEGLDVYFPLVDDNAVDAVIRRDDGSFITIQIKAKSKDVIPGDAALFAAIPHKRRDNYWFIFYSERMDMTWILTSENLLKNLFKIRPARTKENAVFGSMAEKMIARPKRLSNIANHNLRNTLPII